MNIYEIDDLKDELPGLSLQEKRERLEEIQSEIDCELEELETASSEIGGLLSDVKDEINEEYSKEIRKSLEEVATAEQLLSVAPKIKKMAKEYKLV